MPQLLLYFNTGILIYCIISSQGKGHPVYLDPPELTNNSLSSLLDRGRLSTLPYLSKHHESSIKPFGHYHIYIQQGIQLCQIQSSIVYLQAVDKFYQNSSHMMVPPK